MLFTCSNCGVDTLIYPHKIHCRWLKEETDRKEKNEKRMNDLFGLPPPVPDP